MPLKIGCADERRHVRLVDAADHVQAEGHTRCLLAAHGAAWNRTITAEPVSHQRSALNRWSVAVWHPHGVAYTVLVQHVVGQVEPELIHRGVAPVAALIRPVVAVEGQRRVPAARRDREAGRSGEAQR